MQGASRSGIAIDVINMETIGILDILGISLEKKVSLT